MRKRIYIILFAAAFMVAQAAAAPQLTAQQALQIASDYLRDQGYANAHFISALTLQPTSLVRKKYDWVVEWTPSVDLGDRRETGLRIAMDGTVARVVTKTAKERTRDVNRQSARDMR